MLDVDYKLANTQTEGPWRGFSPGTWRQQVDVREFIQRHYTPHEGDGSFLQGATPRTRALWQQLLPLLAQEREKGVLDVSQIPSGILAHAPGYIDRECEIIVGLQTDAPLKRAIMPFGGWRVVEGSLKAYGYEPDSRLAEIFTKYRKTHNDGVFDAYTPEIRKARSSGLVTGLPDSYGRGRIIGDYRRVALYGIDFLVADKQREKGELDPLHSTEDVIRLREELAEQLRSLHELKEMAARYGFDISGPAGNAREAVQWTYFGYLSAIKQQNGAAMSAGRLSTFWDIYFERDLRDGTLDESQAQEIIDDLVIKWRLVRFLRAPEYNQLFSGDPVWVTEVVGGMGEDGRTLVTKTAFRMLQTLHNLGPAPEPNLTVFWSPHLPEGFKRFAVKTSIDTSAIQYESDELMRPKWGDDCAIACCVSAMRLGKQMQFFGARVNLAKTLLYALNGGRDELSGEQVGPELAPIEDGVLRYEEVMKRLDTMMDWLARIYVNALNVIHYMHDKYCYEAIEMALHDRDILRTLACGIAGLSHAADSLSAIKHARVKPVRGEGGLIVDFDVEGEFPCYGNNDDRADELARMLVSMMMGKIRQYPSYRAAVHTQSVLTITSNVVYGKSTGNTPDGRRQGEPFAPGANPSNGRDTHGALATLMSVAKIPYDDAEDGISLTMSVVPTALGSDEERLLRGTGALDAYFSSGGFHVNVNVLNRETLQDAMAHPVNYPQLTIRVSGYAVNFVKLSREQQLDVINRTFHASM
ncbi:MULTISPECIES: formate C-acetyltransferase [Ramlibacter]|uniref:Formate acetyltransferase n=1 Tax=Ramlibacter pinisoli TaxID=2682844 RepID=A0A6N8IPG7_9BURK|nr:MULTISPECIES: formate C-acetyltransferase [Ramlibacter]MBA2963805.1 formate C-acetyltransferase [Ramlibacter sp. CGMCC 1.13660]MVQ28771.1 formate C-acetyltransferase [Ramlibacter pinisoli]